MTTLACAAHQDWQKTKSALDQHPCPNVLALRHACAATHCRWHGGRQQVLFEVRQSGGRESSRFPDCIITSQVAVHAAGAASLECLARVLVLLERRHPQLCWLQCLSSRV